MRKAYISSTICILAAATMWNLCTIHAKADSRENALESIYQQIAVENKNVATVTYNGDMLSINEIQLYINKKDDPDNLFDGKVACERGHYYAVMSGNTYTLTLKNAYEVEEADELTDMMVSVINERLGNNTSDRIKMAAICDYITETFDYDYDLENRINNREKNIQYTNFVDAYNGNRKIICGDYAQLTYILANKMGIDCEMIYGVDHAYNRVKFSDSDHYIGYDLSSDLRYAQITAADYFINSIYHLEDATTANSRNDPAVEIAMNDGATYECAGIKDLSFDYIYNTFIARHLLELCITAGVSLLILNTVLKALRKRIRAAGRKRAARARIKTERA